MAVDRNRQNAFCRFLPNHILVELSQNLAWRGDPREQLLARSAALAFLIENALAKLDAFAADVNVAWPFDQRTDVSIALPTKRTERVLLGCAAAACGAADVPARRHAKLLPVSSNLKR